MMNIIAIIDVKMFFIVNQFCWKIAINNIINNHHPKKNYKLTLACYTVIFTYLSNLMLLLMTIW